MQPAHLNLHQPRSPIQFSNHRRGATPCHPRLVRKNEKRLAARFASLPRIRRALLRGFLLRDFGVLRADSLRRLRELREIPRPRRESGSDTADTLRERDSLGVTRRRVR